MSRTDQRTSCAGLESTGRNTRKPPPLLRSRTLPAIVVPGVNIIQAQLGNYNVEPQTSSHSRFHTSRMSFSRDDTVALDMRRKSAVSRLCGSGNYGPERGSDGTLLLRYVLGLSEDRIVEFLILECPHRTWWQPGL